MSSKYCDNGVINGILLSSFPVWMFAVHRQCVYVGGTRLATRIKEGLRQPTHIKNFPVSFVHQSTLDYFIFQPVHTLVVLIVDLTCFLFDLYMDL